MMYFLFGTIRRLWMASVARSLEYLRDGNSLAKTLLLPLTLIAGLAYTFSGPQTPLFKVALISPSSQLPSDADLPFLKTPLIQFYTETDAGVALHKVELQRIDMVITLGNKSKGQVPQYWISQLSQKGEVVERLLLSTNGAQSMKREYVTGTDVRYVDWMVSGILALNIAMSSLFGIGTVVMAQRRSGYLKRLGATPLKPFEFLLAQLFSRLFVVIFVNTLIFAICKYVLNLHMEGSYLNMLVVITMGVVAVSALALAVTSRTSSEELGSGLLSLLFTLMMVVSGAFFSIDGAPRPLQVAASFSPLGHLLDGMRAVMFEGAGLRQLSHDLVMLAAMGVGYLVLASLTFKWRDD